MSRYKFNEDEVPYAILEEFGLNQEMIEDLPVDVYRDIPARLAALPGWKSSAVIRSANHPGSFY